jgi:hypothetical protein
MSTKIVRKKDVVEFNRKLPSEDLAKFNKELALNYIINAITTIHNEADKRLSELSQLCERKAE